MNEIEETNQKAWEIAAQSIMFKNGEFTTYSKSQIRGIFELAKSNNFDKDIEAHIKKYSPQPSRGQRPQDAADELQKMKALNEAIANNIKIIFKTMEPEEKMRFSRYLMWNIKIIEQRMPKIDDIQLVLDCEKVENPRVIIDHLTALSKTNYVQSHRKSERRERNENRRR